MATPDSFLTAEPGTYALGLTLPVATRCRIGALGAWDLPAGDYVYVGSAWGPGGLAARVGRHLRGSAKLHWHIDYLRAHAKPIAIWLAPGTRLECDWARDLFARPEVFPPVPGFGASDCDCVAHLGHISSGFESLMLSQATMHTYGDRLSI